MCGSRRLAVRLLVASLLIFVGLPFSVAAAAPDARGPGEGVEVAADVAAPAPAAPAVPEQPTTSVDAAAAAGVGAGLAILAGAAFATRRRLPGQPQRARNRWR